MDSLTARYAICGPGDVDELVALLARVFTADDPPAVAAGLTPREFEALVELYRTRAATGGLTVVAREASTGEMIGVLLAEDSASPFPEGVERLSPKFAPIFDILGELDSEYRRGRFPMPGESLHLFLLGVSRAFARRKIAQGLVEHCLVVGRRRGYRRAVTEATNTVSQHIFRKLGFADRVRRSYADHRFEGLAVFASIASHGGPVLLDKPLDQ
jgi:ribosomal protein S18 acetylase RimI-like enzyme